MIDHAAHIRARRAASNQAIAVRDPDSVAQFMMPDITVSVANGPLLSGRDANREAFAEQFADRKFRGYVRDTGEVVLHDPPVRATERGRWTGRWGHGTGEQVMRGTYVAQWRYTELGWLIASEVFTPAPA